jgi:hypothetical protein
MERRRWQLGCAIPARSTRASVLAPLTRSVPVLANLLEVQPYTKMQTLFDAAWPRAGATTQVKHHPKIKRRRD